MQTIRPSLAADTWSAVLSAIDHVEFAYGVTAVDITAPRSGPIEVALSASLRDRVLQRSPIKDASLALRSLAPADAPLSACEYRLPEVSRSGAAEAELVGVIDAMRRQWIVDPRIAERLASPDLQKPILRALVRREVVAVARTIRQAAEVGSEFIASTSSRIRNVIQLALENPQWLPQTSFPTLERGSQAAQDSRRGPTGATSSVTDRQIRMELDLIATQMHEWATSRLPAGPVNDAVLALREVAGESLYESLRHGARWTPLVSGTDLAALRSNEHLDHKGDPFVVTIPAWDLWEQSQVDFPIVATQQLEDPVEPYPSM